MAKPKTYCLAEGCQKIATFGDPVDGKRRYCITHKRPTEMARTFEAINRFK